MSDLQDHYRTLLTKKDAEITADTQNKKQGKTRFTKDTKAKKEQGPQLQKIFSIEQKQPNDTLLNNHQVANEDIENAV